MRPSPPNASGAGTGPHTHVRSAAVAGLFYPDDAAELRRTVSAHLRHASAAGGLAAPKAMIVPHAGYVYSGGVAAAAYSLLAEQRARVSRVVLIGPSHRVFLRGAAIPRATAFETPLGRIAIDPELKAAMSARGDVLESDEPHELEHCLEVQLPFLQVLFDGFTLLPIVVGAAAPGYLASLLRDAWGGEETLVLASSDLSHYRSYEDAQKIDADTSGAILRYDASLSGDQACGAAAINGLLELGRVRRLRVAQIARCNSGDTAGDRARVVGYGAFAFWQDVEGRTPSAASTDAETAS